MKIGIISMHRIVNNGSFLQAYALKESVERLSGEKVVFIDFENTILKKKKSFNMLSFILQNLRLCKHIFFPKYWSYLRTRKYTKKFRKFWSALLPVLDLSVTPQYYDGEKYDLVIIGSDEVFNICQFSDEGVSIPWLLLGEGINTKHLISYAAACGQTTVETIKNIGEDNHCTELFNRFDAISIRDENSENVVAEYSDIIPSIHIDPVLLLHEFPTEKNHRPLDFEYILVYAYTRRINSDEEIKAIKEYALKNKLKTVCVNCFQTWCDNYIIASPFELLQYVQEAKCVVTDTFHGTVFSIRCSVPFVSIVRDSNSNKVRYLLKQFELESREYTIGEDFERIMEDRIDYNKVTEVLELERRRSISYLNSQINKAKEDSHE